MADEDSLHLFFNCPSSSNIWNLSNLSNAVNIAVTQGLNRSAAIFPSITGSVRGRISLICNYFMEHMETTEQQDLE